MTIRNTAILLLVCCVITAVVTRYYFPQVQTKTEIVEKEVVRNDIETITEIVDKTKKQAESSKTETKILAKNWMASLIYNKNLDADGYQLSVSRRQLGPLFLTGNLATFDGEFQMGIGLGMEF
jgi:ribosome-binding ATPase YchF (GTP1/OBG family)